MNIKKDSKDIEKALTGLHEKYNIKPNTRIGGRSIISQNLRG